MIATDIRKVWDSIKESMAATINGERVEDIYAACVYGRATLFTCEEGYVVLQILDHPVTGRPELFVWVAYGVGTGLIQKHVPFLLEQAKLHHCETLSFNTARLGFSRALGPEWTLRSCTYERKV